jgi:hypothetical protein
VPIEIITILTFLTIQSLFRWSATDSESIADFKEILVSMQKMIFLIYWDLPESIFWSATDSEALTDFQGFFGANRDNYNFDIFDHPESISLVCD